MAKLNTLGCVSTYDVEVSVYSGFPAEPAPEVMTKVRVGMLEGIEQIDWGRRLNDTSDASIRISKQGRNCCEIWQMFQPWYNDINIYRDGALCWRGPVYRMRETRDQFVLQARDLTAWMDKRVPVTFSVSPTDDASDVLTYVFHAMFLNWFGQPNVPNTPEMDYPNIGIITHPSGKDWGLSTEAWLDMAERSRSYRELITNMVELAPWIEWTMHRNVVVVSPSATYLTPTQARLSAEHFSTDIEIVVDGEAATNWVKATGDVLVGGGPDTVKEDRYAYRPVSSGGVLMPPLCEAVFLPDPTNDVNDIVKLAQRHVDVNVPPVVYANVPDGSTLTPDAPITMNELYCGTRIDVDPGYCWKARPNAYANQASPGGRLSAVDVSWTPEGETVGISLIPLVLETS